MIGWFTRWRRSVSRRPRATSRGQAVRTRRPGLEALEVRRVMAAQLSTGEVEALLDRASAATPSTDAIIAVVDVQGRILGVRTESGVVTSDLGFAIDGAVAKARTGAFFANNQAILTSRTVSHISQSTVTQREVQANPSSADVTVAGPGYVAPVSIGGQFPPGILRQPLVDLFAIEHTNRVSVSAGVGGPLIISRDSYAAQLDPTTPTTAVARGIATMPGGLGIYRLGTNEVVGGLGVFFPGPDGFATYEQGFIPSATQSRAARLNAPMALEAEVIALVTLLPINLPNGSSPLPPLTVTLTPANILAKAGGLQAAIPLNLAQAQNLVTRVNTAARINLGGVALQSFGPQAGPLGVATLFQLYTALNRPASGTVNGTDQPVAPGGVLLLAGMAQPAGWLLPPQSSSLPGGLTAVQVEQLVTQGVKQALKTRAQIRIQPTFAKMVLAVADRDGSLLGVYRMPGATAFSIDVAIAKSRNTAYYASADLQPADRLASVPVGTAFSNRTFRYLAVPKYPSGSSTAPPGPFSILNTPGIDRNTGLNVGGPLPATAFNGTVLGYDSFNPGTNFQATTPAANQNGVIFFPGSTSLYVAASLQGGYGISGDGVDQDDVVTFFGSVGFAAPATIQADQFFVRGIRLPWIKFSRNALAGGPFTFPA